MKTKQDKYIDLNQLPHNNNGTISWKDSVGATIDLFYNGKKHIIEILEYYGGMGCRLKIKLDDIVFDDIQAEKIKKIRFDELLYEPCYKYKTGDIVDNVLILEQCKIDTKTPLGNGIVHSKGYKCKCLIDGFEYYILEREWHGCLVCSNKCILKGVNDVATTNPELIELFLNKEDAYLYGSNSTKNIFVRCPLCGTVKQMKVCTLVELGYVTCDKCSDGVKYPNKFAHEFFNQLSGQYKEYIAEYSPDWANRYSYDNYIKLFDDTEIVVEMDGRFHYCGGDVHSQQTNDAIKDSLALNNNIIVIRINCDYGHIKKRFEHIKNNMIVSLANYFDLSNINWNKCNEAGISSIIFEVSKYYSNHPKIDLHKIAKHFCICMDTLYGYLRIGTELGMCVYIKDDENRNRKTKPVAMYDMNGNLINIYKSLNKLIDDCKNFDFHYRTIRRYLIENKDRPYKGYIFKYTTIEEYQQFYLVLNV